MPSYISSNNEMTSKSIKKFRQIAVDEENYQALQVLGHVPESFNDVITRILKQNKAPTVSQVSSPRHRGVIPGISNTGGTGGTPDAD